MMNFTLSSINWEWKVFNELTTLELYAILQLRQAAFIVEQSCPYNDIDDQDDRFIHLCGKVDGKVVAYLRLLPPESPKSPLYFGRVVVNKKFRGYKVATALVAEALLFIDKHYPQSVTIISAQSYLEKFYNQFDFNRVGDPFDEDGIEHIAMRRNPK